MALFLIESFSICFSEFKNAIKYRIYIYLGGQFSQENCIGVTLGCQFSKEIALGLRWGVNLVRGLHLVTFGCQELAKKSSYIGVTVLLEGLSLIPALSTFDYF